VSDSARTWLSTAADSTRAFSLTTVSMANVERSSESSMVCACRTSVSDNERTWFSTAAVSAPAFWLNATSMAMAERCMESSTRARRSENAASSARVRCTSCTSRASARLASVESSATV
jgi:galactose-1-phosphate uridylyltransferase